MEKRATRVLPRRIAVGKMCVTQKMTEGKKRKEKERKKGRKEGRKKERSKAL